MVGEIMQRGEHMFGKSMANGDAVNLNILG